MTDSGDYTAAQCYPQRPCGRWRTCERCARRRQALIADAADRLQQRAGALRWHILHPMKSGTDALARVRRNWFAKTKPIGAIWTIEKSAAPQAFHLNIITPASTIHHPRDAHYWHQAIAGDVRAVAAYIAKRRQMPRQEDYSGDLYGKVGQVFTLLAEQDQAPIVAAAAAQYAIDSHAMLSRMAELSLTDAERNRRKWTSQADLERDITRPTREEAKDIAAKWLPALQAFKNSK